MPTFPAGKETDTFLPVIFAGMHFDAIHALLFDMDGTLIDSTDAVHRAWARWAARFDLEIDGVMKIVHGRPARDSIRLLAPDSDIEREYDWILAEELRDDEGVVPIGGVPEFLATLSDKPWAIVTSAAKSLALHRIRVAGLPVPKVLVTSDMLAKGKPHPEGFLLAADRLGIAPAHCLVFEDTPVGLAAGLAAGMRRVGLATTFSPAQLTADATVANFREVTWRAGKLTLPDR